MNEFFEFDKKLFCSQDTSKYFENKTFFVEILKSTDFCLFCKSTNFKVFDAITDIPTQKKLHLRLFL